MIRLEMLEMGMNMGSQLQGTEKQLWDFGE